MQPIIVVTTCDKKEIAESIAKGVLEKRLAACVQVTGPVESFYWWEQRIEADEEYQVQMKSEKSLFEPLSQVIRTLHSYEIPEIIGTEICSMDEDYRSWMAQELCLKKE